MGEEVDVVVMATVKTANYVAEDSVLHLAARVAAAVIERLQEGHHVVVSFASVRGLPSSFFNVLLTELASSVGLEVMECCVTFDFDSAAQREIFARSQRQLKESLRPRSR